VEEQQPDGFSAYLRNQTSLHRFFGHQTHRPPRPSLGRITANHGDDAFSFRRLQQCRRTRAILIVKSLFQPRLFVPAPDLAHGFGSQRNQTSDFGSRLAVAELPQRQSAKNSAHRLHSAAEHAVQLIAVRLLEAHLQPPISSHAPG